MDDHPWGWLSLVPSAVTILVAIVSRRVIPALLLGILTAALILDHGNPVQAIERFVAEQLWPSLTDPDRLSVFAFTTLMGAMVGLINRGGGMRGLVRIGARLARTPRSGQLTGWMLGLFVFFDDYANSLLLGKTLQPLTDRLKISREKLAYIVDSTAAPVAGLALVSTWVATEIQYIQDGLDNVSPELGGRAGLLFLTSIPYRFYVWTALLLVPILAITRREFGPMLKAERRARRGDVIGAENTDAAAAGLIDETEPAESTPARWYNAVLPIVVTVAAVVYFLYQSGRDPDSPDQSLQDIFGNADAYASLIWGALWGLATAVGMIASQRLLPWREIQNATWHGAVKMIPALVILWLAGALTTTVGGNPRSEQQSITDSVDQGVTLVRRFQYEALTAADPVESTDTNEPLELAFDQLLDQGFDSMRAYGVATALGLDAATTESIVGSRFGEPPTENAFLERDSRLYLGTYLSSLLEDRLALAWLPTIVFVLSALIAFATGTSWGTMAMVMPLAVELVLRNAMGDGPYDVNQSLVIGTVGGVLAGAIFGDHCSPISDTTVLSSQASGCNHMAHVNTQAPYALVGAALAIVLGTIPLGFGLPIYLIWPLQILGLIGVVMGLGRVVEEEESSGAGEQ
ncbi:MAG: Na+/H+ antiporter NhaC family protein [Pirellulaceae bacterium]